MTTARRIDVVWAVLCGLTVAVWLVAAVLRGDEPRVEGAETAIVLALAGVKARLILGEYMEVRHAPRRLRLLTDAWLGVLLVVLLAIDAMA